jgi:voltage-gated potassium channel
MPNSDGNKNSPLNYLNILVLVLSVYVLIALLVDTFFKLPPEISRLLEVLDNSICVFFIFEFLIRFYKAENKWKFMHWGWIDLVSSIPTFAFLRLGRTLRLIRILRVLRAFRSVRHFVHHLFRNRAYGAFTTISIIAVLMVIFSSIAILQVEHAPNSNIKTAEDAIWWASGTITSGGYGDVYPVTTEGRILASFLRVIGVGLIGIFTGFIASWFMEHHKHAKGNVGADNESINMETLAENEAKENS